jgi:hypothetical protein
VTWDKNWYWQAARSDNLVKIQMKLPLVSIEEEDQPTWRISKTGVYTCADTWNAIRTKYPPVMWWKLVRFPEVIPKHAFIARLAAHDNLTTGDRLLKWGFMGDVLCVFCRGCIEGRNLLFFECCFCRRVWRVNLEKC